MKRWLTLLTASALLVGTFASVLAASSPRPWSPKSSATVTVPVENDPDVPSPLMSPIDRDTYLQKRSEYFFERFSGASFDQIFQGRMQGIDQLKSAASRQGPFVSSSFWTEIGPKPIPNGQTTTLSTPVSGRLTAIAIHPTNPNIVYIGAAQGGVWRSLDGGDTWTPIFDSAASLAIGALALAPTDPTILYVGTGEPNGSADSYFGVGLYRIENADTAPTLYGPFNPTPTTDVIGAKTFTGRSISQILVDPTDAATIYVSTVSGIGGAGGEAFGSTPPITSLRGIYRSTNATSASPAFAKLMVSPTGSISPDVTGNNPVNDMAYDPADPTWNTLVCWLNGNGAAGAGGVWRTTNLKSATPTFSQTFASTSTTARGTFAMTRAGGVTTIYAGTGESASGTSCTTGSGCLRRSVDGGLTWSAKLLGGGGYCGGQCFYDLPVAVSPTDANRVLIGGAGNSTCSRVFAISTNGGSSFSGAGVADVGMHADAHAIAFAPSDPTIAFEVSDGGVWKSTDGGASWTSKNTDGLSATQFTNLSVHPTDAKFTIGGTQDNGTNWYKPDGTWFRADFGDGGYTVIDQNAADNTNVTMYHTYFNQTNAMGYATVNNTANAFDGNWPFFGCGFSGSIANGMTCAATAIRFYAPMTSGPGNPNTLYFGSDVLYRSANAGVTMTKVSQEPIVSAHAISAIAIAPGNDNVRLVALTVGTTTSSIWGTTTGANVLTSMTGAGMPTTKFIGAIRIDAGDPNVAYVGFGGFGVPSGQHIWKTTNLMSGTPTWVAAGAGLPDVPVNALVLDPVVSGRLWAGTDVGVYMSNDGGSTWAPYVTGMPVVAVFGMELQPTSRTLRVATHGRGMWERTVDSPVATDLALVGAEIVDGHPKLTWYATDGANQRMQLYRRTVPGDWALVGDITADGTGMLTYEDMAAVAGRSYEYKIAVGTPTGTRYLGQVWVDVPANASFALSRLSERGSMGSLRFAVSLPTAGPASLELLDVSGRRVTAMELGGLGAGDHQVTLDAANASSGVYFARLSQAGKMLSTRVVLVR